MIHRRDWGLVLLIVLCVGTEAILILGDLGQFNQVRFRQTAYEYGGFWSGLLGPWTPNYSLQPYSMFITYGFLHSGPVHLLFNMIMLWSLGTMVIDRVGSRGFALIYLIAVIGGAIGFGLLASTTQPMVGASGGLFGLLGATLAWNYIDRFIAERRLWPIAQSVLGLFVLNLVMWWLMNGLLAWETHLGGFLCGWVGALLVDPRSRS